MIQFPQIDRSIASLCLVLLGLASLDLGCSKRQEPTAEQNPGNQPAKVQPAAQQVTLQGSGASFPAPLYSRWFREFSNKNPDIRVNYQATGSGAGIKAFVAGQTDFGASDAARSESFKRRGGGQVANPQATVTLVKLPVAEPRCDAPSVDFGTSSGALQRSLVPRKGNY